MWPCSVPSAQGTGLDRRQAFSLLEWPLEACKPGLLSCGWGSTSETSNETTRESSQVQTDSGQGHPVSRERSMFPSQSVVTRTTCFAASKKIQSLSLCERGQLIWLPTLGLPALWLLSSCFNFERWRTWLFHLNNVLIQILCCMLLLGSWSPLWG